jgi:hypothetical protein
MELTEQGQVWAGFVNPAGICGGGAVVRHPGSAAATRRVQIAFCVPASAMIGSANDLTMMSPCSVANRCTSSGTFVVSISGTRSPTVRARFSCQGLYSQSASAYG